MDIVVQILSCTSSVDRTTGKTAAEFTKQESRILVDIFDKLIWNQLVSLLDRTHASILILYY